MTLEEQLRKIIALNGVSDVERALLIASGCDTEKQIAEYKAKMDQLQKQFKDYVSERAVNGLIEKAKAVHGFLWEGTPYTRWGRHLLYTETIDARLNFEPIGEDDCVGACSLCALLGLGNGIRFTVLFNNKHVMLRLKADKIVDIDCYSPSGFDINVKRSRLEVHERLREYGLIALMSLTYNNRGARNGKSGSHKRAMAMFTNSIEIMPNATAYYNRASAKRELGDWKGAEEDIKMYETLEGEPQ